MERQIQLRFLGTGTIAPDPQRSCSATILETDRETILVDVGAGTLHRLAIEGINIHSIGYIFITHFHPDHIGDLIPLLFAIRHTRRNTEDHPLRIWGPAGFYRYLNAMERAYGRWVHRPTEDIKYYELKRRLLDFPGFRVIWSKVIHTQESIGYRFEIGGKSIAFSGDSGYCSELIRLCKDADAAILECSHADEFAVKGHLSPSLAGKIAQDAAVKKIILNHFYPDALSADPVEAVRKYYSGEVLMAEDGRVFPITMPAS